MDFNALDLLASTAVLQTRDSDSNENNSTNQHNTNSDGNTDQSTENDEDGKAPVVDVSLESQEGMGSMKKKKDSCVSTVDVAKSSVQETLDLDVDIESVDPQNHFLGPKNSSDPVTANISESNTSVSARDIGVSARDISVSASTAQTVGSVQSEDSDTDSCVEEDLEVNIEDNTTTVHLDNSINTKNKTIMRSLLTGQTVCDESSELMPNTDLIVCKNINCDDKDLDVCSVLGSQNPTDNSAIDVRKTDVDNSDNVEAGGASVELADNRKWEEATLNDSVLESSQSVSDDSPCVSEKDSLHGLVVSDHCYASVPGKSNNLRYSFLEEPDAESDSGIDGNSSSEEADNRTSKSLKLDSQCLQCGFPEISGRSGQLLSQGSSDLDHSPITQSGCSLGLSVLSPTFSSSDSQCSDNPISYPVIENSSVPKYGNLSILDGKKYKTVDFDYDHGVSNSSNSVNHDLPMVGKFKIGKFASFTNIDDSDSEKVLSPDPYVKSYGMSSSGVSGLPTSPSIPSLLQSPCGDWDRSDAGSEALDDLDSSTPPEEHVTGRELLMVLQGGKSPHMALQVTLSATVHHDHDYCFRSGLLPSVPQPVNKKQAKGEKRKYMTAARSRGTTPYLKEQRKAKSLKIKNKKGLSETIEKVKNSLATTPVSIDCNFKKPEQPVNSLLYEKLAPINRQRRVKSLDIKEEESSELELDSASKLKITGKFQNDFVYFLNKTSRNRRRASVESLIFTTESKKVVQPAKPIDIIVPHLTDDDLEVLQTKGRAGLAMLDKFSSNPHLLDRFSANLQTKNSSVKCEKSSSHAVGESTDDDKIINTILSMENDNLGSPTPVATPSDMDYFSGEETINLMGENMTLTRDQVDLLLNAVKNVPASDDYITTTVDDKLDLVSPDHSSTCSNDVTTTQDWTNKSEKIDTEDTESTYSSSDVGQASNISDIKEESQESFELKESDIERVTGVKTENTTSDNSVVDETINNDSTNNSDNKELTSCHMLATSGVVSSVVNSSSSVEMNHEDMKPIHMNNGLINSSLTLSNNVIDKSISIDTDPLNPLTLTDSKPDKLLLDSELHGFSNNLPSSLSDLGLPLEKSFELLGSEFRLDKSDELFPEANVEPAPIETSDYNDTPWVVTVTVFWNDLPAIMINNWPYIRLVDIHKTILPAKDTGILKKRCQLLSIHVLNCSEMQRYFLVQYGRGYNSKSTLIVSKADACQLVGYYAQPPPRLPRSEEGHSVPDLSHLSQHMALFRGKPSNHHNRFIRKKRSGHRINSRTTSPERKENVKSGMVVAPVQQRVRKPIITPPVVQSEVSKRLRHKKINFLEMLKGDIVNEKTPETEDSIDSPTPDETSNIKKVTETKKSSKQQRSSKKKELPIEVELSSTSSSEDEDGDDEYQVEDNIDNLSCEAGSSDGESDKCVKPIKCTNAKKTASDKTSGGNVKKSPNNKSPTNGRKLGPLRVNVKGLLHFPKSKSAISKNERKGLDIIHTPLELETGVTPISQTGSLLLDLYKKKSSLCVRCGDCEKLLSIATFLQHQHYPQDHKTLTTVLESQTLSLRVPEASRTLKQAWEEFQKRHEKFEGFRFVKPVIKTNQEKVNMCKEKEEIVTPPSSPLSTITTTCDPILTTDQENEDNTVNMETSSDIPQDINIPTIKTDDNKLDITDKVDIDKIAAPPTEHVVNLTKTPETSQEELDKSGVRSSSRKRKSRQYFSFENYSFSSKKTKLDDSDSK